MRDGAKRGGDFYGVQGLSKRFGAVEVFREFSMEVAHRGVTVVLGPSGCGKTTLLKCLCGLEPVPEGSFPGLEGSRFSMIFQEARLLPWATVRENLELVCPVAAPAGRSAGGRRGAGYPRPGSPAAGGPAQVEASCRIEPLLEAVELTGFENAYPQQLSGGMAQRVALARAFMVSAQTLLLDEPFRALDIALRIRMYDLFRRLWERERPTTIFVTHNVEEAVLQGDRIVVLSQKPATVAADLTNTVAYSDRHLDHKDIRDLQTEIYRLLLEAAVS
ncbi:MAG: ABC transporter ATP-binding protein [bacterium]